MPELQRNHESWVGIEIANISPLPADASSKVYHRLRTKDDLSYILMNCSVDPSSIEPFIKIAELLKYQGISAPDVYRYDEKSTSLLLEDLGEVSIKKFLVNNPKQAKRCYRLVVDVLVQVQRITPPGYLIEHNQERLFRKLQFFSRWYWLAVTGSEMPPVLEQQFLEEWRIIFDLLPHSYNVVVLGDFHTENLMYLPDRTAEKSVGVLDFQDAYLGHPLYDLASLLNDARSFVPGNLRDMLIDYYAQKSQMPLTHEQIKLSFNILGAARNMQILGIFARKVIRDNIKHYLNMIPRVLDYLHDNLTTHEINHMLRFLPQAPLSV